MKLDVRTEGLGLYVDLPGFYNENRSMSEIDADDIPGSGQLENWVSYYLDVKSSESINCLAIKKLIYTISGEIKLGKDLDFPSGYLEHLGYGVVPINNCRGTLGLSAIEDELTEGNESFRINFWPDTNFSNLLYSDEVDIIDTSLGRGDTTNVDNTFVVQATNINLRFAITGKSKRNEKVRGTKGDDIIADGRGTDKLIGRDGADLFYFAGKEPFKKKTADKLIDFNLSEGDAIVISDSIFDGQTKDPVLAIADTKKDLKKLSKEGYDLVYFKDKGHLYIDGNGYSKGFGKKSKGGIIADLPNDTVLTESDVLIGV